MWFAAITLYILFAYFFPYLDRPTCLFKQFLQVKPTYYSDFTVPGSDTLVLHRPSATSTHATLFSIQEVF